MVVAPKAGPQLPPELELGRNIYENGVGDSRGYYHDGAYTAAPDPAWRPADGETQASSDHDDSVKQQLALVEAYNASLLSRYHALRTLLQTVPSQAALNALPPVNETEVGGFGPNQQNFKKWENKLRHTDPLPAQIAAMDKGSVLRLLRIILQSKFLRRGYTLRERTSRWIWALLARLPDRGELDSVEIGWVRDLGKRAVAVSISREHARALSEVVDRSQLEAFGLRSVLNEIDEENKDEEEEDMELEEDEEELEEGEPVRGNNEQVDKRHSRANSSSLAPGEFRHLQPAAALQAVEEQRLDDDSAMDAEDGEVFEAEDTLAHLHPVEEAEEAVSDMEDGEIADEEPSTNRDISNAIAAAKARLLASLGDSDTPNKRLASAPQQHDEADLMADKFNMRTTVNMILTVAGEFYGQRDLLQFRAPFAEL